MSSRCLLFVAGLGRHCREDFSKLRGGLQRRRIPDAAGPVAIGEVHALAVERGDTPVAGLRPGKNGRIEADGVAVIVVHVGDRAFLDPGDAGRIAPCGEIIGGQFIGLAEAAIQAGALDGDPEEGEVAEIGVEFSLRLAGEIAPADAAALVTVALAPVRPGRTA